MTPTGAPHVLGPVARAACLPFLALAAAGFAPRAARFCPTCGAATSQPLAPAPLARSDRRR